MIITIENTDRIVELNGVPARIWEGKSEKGVEVICFVTRILVRKDADNSQFEAELNECRPVSAVARAIDPRLVL